MTSVSGEGWSATIDVPDMQWASEGCQDLVFDIEIVDSGAGITYWEVAADVRVEGAEEPTFDFYVANDEPGTFTVLDLTMCPGEDPNRAYDVTGEVRVQTGGPEFAFVEPYSTRFLLMPRVTETTLDSITVDQSQTLIRGTVLAYSWALAELPVDPAGVVWALVYPNSDQAFPVPLAQCPIDAAGAFVCATPTRLPEGTSVIASYQGTTTCATSSSLPLKVPPPTPVPTPTPTPTPPPFVRPPTFPIPGPAVTCPSASVVVKSVRKQSRLFVDVDPDQGSRYWSFIVQRRTKAGKWVKVGTYRTRGSHETRTINLRRGTYRVMVKPKFGLLGAWSTEVYLKK